MALNDVSLIDQNGDEISIAIDTAFSIYATCYGNVLFPLMFKHLLTLGI